MSESDSSCQSDGRSGGVPHPESDLAVAHSVVAGVNDKRRRSDPREGGVALGQRVDVYVGAVLDQRHVALDGGVSERLALDLDLAEDERRLVGLESGGMPSRALQKIIDGHARIAPFEGSALTPGVWTRGRSSSRPALPHLRALGRDRGAHDSGTEVETDSPSAHIDDGTVLLKEGVADDAERLGAREHKDQELKLDPLAGVGAPAEQLDGACAGGMASASYPVNRSEISALAREHLGDASPDELLSGALVNDTAGGARVGENTFEGLALPISGYERELTEHSRYAIESADRPPFRSQRARNSRPMASPRRRSRRR